MKKIILRIFKIFFNCIIIPISYLIPKSKKFVLIGGWQGYRFADNSRGIFLYLNEHKEELGIDKVIWFTKNKQIASELQNKGYDVLLGLNIKSIYWHLRSKVHMIDHGSKDILGFLSVRCIRINLWHGFPLKKIGNFIEKDEIINLQKWYNTLSSGGCWPNQYLLATSELSANVLSQAMGVNKDKIIIASYPRNHDLYESMEFQQQNIFKIFYLPTFRDNKIINPILEDDLDKFNTILKDNNCELYIKPHFASSADWDKANGYSSIKLLDAKYDVYEFLKETNLLITDYSSVYFDFLLTNRPILFFPYDIDYYGSEDRGFIFPYNEFTPGAKVFEVSKLMEMILYIKKNYREYQKKYENCYISISNQINRYTDSYNYDELLKLIKNSN